MNAIDIDTPTGPKPTCPPFCTQHFADGVDGPGFCFASDANDVGMSYGPREGESISIYQVSDGMTAAQARTLAAALLVQADRAEQARVAFTFPATR